MLFWVVWSGLVVERRFLIIGYLGGFELFRFRVVVFIVRFRFTWRVRIVTYIVGEGFEGRF